MQKSYADSEVVSMILANGKWTDQHFVMTWEGKEEKQKGSNIPISKPLKSVTTLISMQMFSLPLSPIKTSNIAYSALQ